MGYSHKGLTYLNPILQVVRKIGVALHIVSPNRLRVLIYHDIPSEEEGAFRKQMHSLKKHWNIITPSEFEQMITGGSQVNGDNLLITFDDGFSSNRIVAENVLNPLGIKAIFFVISDFVKIKDRAESHKFIADHIIPGSKVLDIPKSWGNMQLKDLSALIKQGHTIGWHTKLHNRLSECSSKNELEDELILSSENLSHQLGIEINHFAYTFGDLESFSEAAHLVAKRKFRFIYSGLRGNNIQNISPLAIRRDAAAYQLPNNEYRVFNNRLLDSFLGGFADFRYKLSKKILDSWCRES